MLTTIDRQEDIDGRHGPVSARAGLFAGLRRGAFPVVPPALADAVAALDGLEEVGRAVLAPAANFLGRPGAADGLGSFCEQVATNVLAGQPYPADFATAAYDAVVAHETLQAATIATERIRTRLEGALPAVVTEALPDLLGGLRSQLVEEVMAELLPTVEALGDLDIADAEAVAGATGQQRKALVALGELRSRYNLLRLAQRDAYQASDHTPPGATSLSVDHGWREVFATGIAEFSGVGAQAAPPPKPTTERLIAVARRSDVWLPDYADLVEAWTKLHPAPSTPSLVTGAA